VKRRLITLGVLLLLGAVVNVAVAWGLAMVKRPVASYERTGQYRSRDKNPDLVMEQVEWAGYSRLTWVGGLPNFEGAPGTDLLMAMGEDWRPKAVFPPTWSRIDWHNRGSPESLVLAIESATGWPQLTMASFGFLESHGIRIELASQSGLALDQWTESFETPRIIPLRPIWPGFAINTLFYAAVCWMLFAVPGVLRRKRRRRRGRCVHCGYDLRGHASADPTAPSEPSTACPECGKPLSPRRGEGKS